VTDFSLTRRGALQGSAVVVVGGVVGFLVARTSAAARTAGTASAANAYGPPTASSGHLLARLDQVPAGGGVVVGKDAVVVTRTASGDVHAFSAVCTHQGCTVNHVGGGTIDCPCHGSRFDAQTGAVRAGPATRPLAPVAVSVRDGGIYRS
jgi:Rieske Fe-S protein